MAIFSILFLVLMNWGCFDDNDSGNTKTGTIGNDAEERDDYLYRDDVRSEKYPPKIEGPRIHCSGDIPETMADPHWISNITGLQNMNKNMSAHYLLACDIDASSTRGWNEGNGFDPIGRYSDPFAGSLGGRGYNITGLFINRSGNDVGLFGCMDSNGFLNNIDLIEVDITGNNNLGGLVGNNRGQIDNSTVMGDVNGYYNVGGLVGKNTGVVTNCSVTGSVDGNENVGGLVGKNYLGNIYNCSAANNINGLLCVGGLVGDCDNIVENCSSTGNICGNERIGGLIGNSWGDVNNCFSCGNVSGNYNYIGGLIGFLMSGTVDNCYAKGNVSGKTTYVGGLVGYTSSFTRAKDSFYCIDHSTVNGKKSPTLYGIYKPQFDDWIARDMAIHIDDHLKKIQGTNCYNISSIADMKSMLPFALQGYNFRQSSDIDLSPEPDFHIPVISGGVFDGNGFRISNLNISIPYENYLGLFGHVWNNARISNVSLIGIDVSGNDCIGGLVGSCGDDSVVSNCSVIGDVSGSEDVGGLIGHCDKDSYISKCHVKGNIVGDFQVGGLIGFNERRTNINYCYVAGNNSGDSSGKKHESTVSGDSSVGGLIGYNLGAMAKCYSTGNVCGNRFVGGLIGHNQGIVEKCYSAGKVSGGSSTGGLVGSNYYEKVLHCFWDNETSGQSFSDGGSGKNTSQMMSKKTYTDSGWDFSTTWSIFEGYSYPFFLWEPSSELEVRITTTDVTVHEEDMVYAVDYEYDVAFHRDEHISWKLDTNATWLTLDETTGYISGTPTNVNVGRFWVNISVVADKEHYDYSNFTLTLKNMPPIITTKPNNYSTEDELYFVDFDSDEDNQGTIAWEMDTDSIWLYFDNDTGELRGTPTNEDVGQYMVSVSVNDGNGGIGWYNYSITVFNVNDPPHINTTPLTTVIDGERYSVLFNATDEDPVADKLTWELMTNATWLDMDADTGYLSGIASEGIFWVKVTVSDGHGGTDHTHFTITVKKKDSDNDGIADKDDAFPYDPAASVDSDHDGMPDRWNPGMSENNSTSHPPLELDQFPEGGDEKAPEDDGNKTLSEETRGMWFYILWVMIIIVAVILAFSIYFGTKKPPEDDFEFDEFGRLHVNQKLRDRTGNRKE